MECAAQQIDLVRFVARPQRADRSGGSHRHRRNSRHRSSGFSTKARGWVSQRMRVGTFAAKSQARRSYISSIRATEEAGSATGR